MAASSVVTASPQLNRIDIASRDQYRVQCIDRAMELLDLLSESDTLPGLAAVCQGTRLHKSTAHRLLMVLERAGMIERTEENRFRLGLKLYELGLRALDQIDLRTHARPHLLRLSEQVRETVHLGLLQKSTVVYLEKLEAFGRPVCPASNTGASNPVYCTSLGKAMLAFLPPAAAEDIIAGIRFRRFTAKTLCSKEDLRSALDRVRRRGYATDDEEVENGVRCIGAPIFGAGGAPLAAVSISGPVARITSQRASGIAEHVVRCCRDISASFRTHALRRAHSAAPRRTAESTEIVPEMLSIT